jgi:Putative lumazine-binding
MSDGALDIFLASPNRTLHSEETRMDSSSTPDTRPTPADRNAILQASRDYIEAWYTADAARMQGCLHPDLAKRTVFHDEPQGTWTLRHTDARMMVSYTQEGRGTRTPEPALHPADHSAGCRATDRLRESGLGGFR